MNQKPVNLKEDSLLWLINRQVFHPRGYALAIDTTTGEFSLIGDGDEPFVFPGNGSDERFHLAKIKEVMP